MATTVDGSTGVSQIQDDKVTVDKLDLISTGSVPSLEAKGTSGVTSGYLKLNCSENSHGIKLLGPPHSATADYTLTFPNNDGDADQFLQTNGSGVMSWAAPSGGGMTLLSTLTTTSGTSHVTGTLDLTGFKFVLITTQQVSHSSGTSQALQFTPNTGGAYGLGNYSIPSSFRWTSFSNIELATGTYTAFLPNDMAVPSQPVAFLSAGLGNNNAFTTSVTSISFGWSASGTFDAGSIRVYGLS